MLVMHFGNYFIKLKVDATNVILLLYMIHYEEISYMMKYLRTGKIVIMLCVLIYFSFINVYNQNVRSSTIEPLFESLPNHIREINPRVKFLMSLPDQTLTPDGLSLQYKAIVESGRLTNCNTLPKHFAITTTMSPLKLMAKRSDVVGAVSKSYFMNVYLYSFQHYIRLIKG